jgi:hypothetical protein
VRLWRHFLVGLLCCACVTLPYDFYGVESAWVTLAGFLVGIATMLLSAWLSDRQKLKQHSPTHYGQHERQ